MSDRAARCIATLVLLGAATTAHAQHARALDDRTVNAWAMLLRTHDLRSADTNAIDVALASAVAPLRAAAARVVGLNRIGARYPTLRAMLQTERDTAAASDAAFALGLAADTASCGALRGALRRSGTGVAAAWALGEMGTRCGEFDAILAPLRMPLVRASLLRAAVKWAPFPDSAVLAAYRPTASGAERWAALYAFARARRTTGAELAFRASHDSDPSIRDVATRLLASTAQPAEAGRRSIARLDSLLRDPAPHVRIAAVRSLASYKDMAVAPLRRAWRAERDANVRVSMAQAIGGVAADTAALWSEWWNSDTTHMIRRSLIASAWQAGAMATMRMAAGDSLAVDPDFRIRIAMIDGAASKNVDQHVSEIAARIADPDPRVRAAALGALGRSSPSVGASLGLTTVLSSALRDADAGVRAAALDGIARSATASDIGVALDAFEHALHDVSVDARASALDLVAAAWRRDSVAVPDSLRERLRQLAPPADPLLLRRVLPVTPLAHWAGARSTDSVALAVYQGIVRDVIAPGLLGRSPNLVITTPRGAIRILLDGVRAPMTSDHLMRLARAGYFRDLCFHRVVPAFVAQGGDPRGDGSGGPGFAIRDELNRSAYVRGAVGVALSGPDTGGSQFFLTLVPQPHLDGHYTVFGTVVSGLGAMDALTQGDVIRNIEAVAR